MICLALTTACQKEEPIQRVPQKVHYSKMLDVDLSRTDLSKAEKKNVKRISKRISDNITFDADGRMTLTSSMIELNISEESYRTIIDIIEWYNSIIDEGIEVIIRRPIPTTKSSSETENTNTRGGTLASDAIATAISSAFGAARLETAKKLFDMWYFDYRSADYSMTTTEWNTAKDFADTQIGDDYTHGETHIAGHNYYSNQVNYYDATLDLKLSYGNATVYFDSDGDPVGFSDTYDFNLSAQRNWLIEKSVEIANLLGGGEGYDIYYGIH